MRTLKVGLAGLVLTLNACAGSSAEAPYAASGGYASEPGAKAAPPEGIVAAQAAPPPPPLEALPSAPASRSMESSGGATSMAPSPSVRAAEPPPETRPGLGTEWGETRSSHIHDVDFERSDWTHPFAVATLHYNDRRGVEAMAAYRAWHGPRNWEERAANGAITVSVRDEDNQPLDAVHLGNRTYVIGEQGARYAIVVQNHSDHRIEAVATVDGLDVMNGQPGSVENRGYVVDPYQTITIDGFRQSHATVAAFRFAKVGDSYAAQTGSARNVGVIGVAFFDERGDAYARWTVDEIRLRETADPFPTDHRFAQPPRPRW